MYMYLVVKKTPKNYTYSNMPGDNDQKSNVVEFVKKHSVAVLSTITLDNKPYSSTVYVVLDEELNFYFITRAGTRKLENIDKNNNASITIFDTTEPKTIQAQGKLEIVENSESLRNLFIEFAQSTANEKGGQHWPPPITKFDNDNDITIVKFSTYWLRIGDFSDKKDIASATEDVFKQIIP